MQASCHDPVSGTGLGRAPLASRCIQKKLGLQYQSFALSSATTQWGSCTANGRISLHWRLMHFDLPPIDYVIARELAHLRGTRQGLCFWAAVQSVFVEFEAAKKVLRKHALETPKTPETPATPKTLPTFFLWHTVSQYAPLTSC